jgi:phage-related protein
MSTPSGYNIPTIFPWQPDYGASNSVTPNVLTAKYGDGYSQDQPLGINYIAQVWTLTFNRNHKEADQIYNFLMNQGGYLRFWWTPPRQEQAIKVKTTGKIGKAETDAHQTTITATFQQVFDPD